MTAAQPQPSLEQELTLALVDFYTDGHHLPYFRAVVDGLRSAKVHIGAAIVPSGMNVPCLANVVELPGWRRLAAVTGLRRQWRAFPICCRAFDIALSAGCTHIDFLRADWHVLAIAMAWCLKRPNLKLFLTIHSNRGVGAGQYEGIRMWIRRLPLRIAFRLLMRLAGANALVHHETEKKDLGLMASPRQIHVGHYPVSPPPTVSIAEIDRFRMELGLGTNDRLALCYGGTRYDKGADLAVRALALMATRLHLLVAGEPVAFTEHKLTADAASLGCETRFHMMPTYLSDDEEALVLQACDLVLLPYRRAFVGQSGPLTQAGAIGKPVVVPDLRTLADTVNDFCLGAVYAAESVEAMARAVESVADWKPTGQNTKEFLRAHSSLALGEAMHSMYVSAR